MFQHYDLSCDNLYNTLLFSLGLFEVYELILFYYFVVLTNCVWPLLQKFLLHKPKLLLYVAAKFLSSYLVLLHVDMVII